VFPKGEREQKRILEIGFKSVAFGVFPVYLSNLPILNLFP
jgi:hypothetical protein